MIPLRANYITTPITHTDIVLTMSMCAGDGIGGPTAPIGMNGDNENAVDNASVGHGGKVEDAGATVDNDTVVSNRVRVTLYTGQGEFDVKCVATIAGTCPDNLREDIKDADCHNTLDADVVSRDGDVVVLKLQVVVGDDISPRWHIPGTRISRDDHELAWFPCKFEKGYHLLGEE
jgi:hypothetical protein